MMHARWVMMTAGWLVAALPWTATAEQVSTTALRLDAARSQPSAIARPDAALLDQLARTYTTPTAIAQWLRRDFTFQRDQELFGEVDRWQTPEEFATRRTGDCEDYALLARELLRRNGIEAFLFSLFGSEGYAHTVCVFKDERGRYNVLDQDALRWSRAKTLEEVASGLRASWVFGGIVEPQQGRGRLIVRLTNAHPVPALDVAAPLANFQF